MSRRVVGVTLVGTSVLLGMPASHGDTPPPPQLPMATCDAHIKDGPNDGIPNLSVVQVNPLPPVTDPRGNVPGLDITSIALRVTDTRVYAFMAIADIPDSLRSTDSAYAYTMWFKRGGKYAVFSIVYTNASLVAEGLAPADAPPTATVGSGTGAGGGETLTGIGGAIDKAKNVAYVYADRASLEGKVGGPFEEGEELSSISGRTELWETDGKAAPGPAHRPADTADDVTPEKAVWDVGDDGCFAASTIAVTAGSAQYGDPVTLTATLKDDAGAPLASRKVTVTVPGEAAPRSLTTDAAGTVRIVLDAVPPAGTYTVKVAYRGDELSGAGEGTAKLTVRAETVRIAKLAVKPSGTSRIVTATLTEDDPRAFANQPVAWYVNGKKVATVNTDAAGRSVFKGAKPGQKVQARYAGVAGRYLAAVSNTATV